MPVLTARGAGVRHRRRWLFRDLDVAVEPGETVAVVGPPGSGRTTVLLALERRLRLSAGHVSITGRAALGHVPGAPAFRVALAGLLPGAAIGLAQASLLFAVVTLGLCLAPVHPVATWGLLALTAVAFAAIMQLIGAAFGAAGRIVGLVLLMLQLTSSGGPYPVPTTPGFFQAIHPLLPMSYAVQAARHTIDGGSWGAVGTGGLVLLGFGLSALAVTVLVAYGKGILTFSALHPELVI